jgi:hypothetical protein
VTKSYLGDMELGKSGRRDLSPKLIMNVKLSWSECMCVKIKVKILKSCIIVPNNPLQKQRGDSFCMHILGAVGSS